MRGRRKTQSLDSELVTYLTFDSVVSGVGRSQILPYVEKLAALGIKLKLVTFEKTESELVRDRLRNAGVYWTPQSFGRPGALGGLLRTIRAIGAVRGSSIVHARSDLPAFAAHLARCPYVLWDCRAFWTDQRIAMGSLRRRSPVAFVIRRIESLLAKRSSHINVLTASGKSRLLQKYGADVEKKISVISTCVDLEKFQSSPLPNMRKLRVLLSGSLNELYDLPRMMEIFEHMKRLAHTEFVVATNDVSRWESHASSEGLTVGTWDHDAMPELISSCHVGLVVCVDRQGDSLTATMPTKIAEFLASGRPIVVNSRLADAALLIEEYRCGIIVGELEAPELVAGRIFELLHKDCLIQSCRIAAEEKFSLDDAVDQLASIYSLGASHL